MNNRQLSLTTSLKHKQMYPNNLLYDIIEVYLQQQDKKPRTTKQKQGDQMVINQILQLDYLPLHPILILAKQSLGKREQTVINSRYIDHLTLKECGQQLSLSRERVRQIQVEVLSYFIQIGLAPTLVDLIWPLPKELSQVVAEGYVLPLKHTFKTLLFKLIPKAKQDSMDQYYQRLYDSIFKPVYRKFGIKNVADFKHAMQKGK